MRELPKIAPRCTRPEDRVKLDAAIANDDARQVVRWLVVHLPAVMRAVPRERRYQSFLRGVASVLDADATWSLDPRSRTT